MLTKLNIGTRMALAFACLVLLSLGLAGSGYWGLANVTSTAETILKIDVVAAETVQSVVPEAPDDVVVELRAADLLEPVDGVDALADGGSGEEVDRHR